MVVTEKREGNQFREIPIAKDTEEKAEQTATDAEEKAEQRSDREESKAVWKLDVLLNRETPTNERLEMLGALERDLDEGKLHLRAKGEVERHLETLSKRGKFEDKQEVVERAKELLGKLKRSEGI